MGIIRSLSYILFFSVLLLLQKNNLEAKEKPREEIMVVQTVSTDRRSFVMGKGVKDGIVKGLEIIFANENASILCKAAVVNRNYSLWIPVDKNINVPFNKNEFISYNSHAYGNISLDIVGDVNKITPEINYQIEFSKFRNKDNFSLKASLDKGLSQSSSDVSADKNSKRSGYSFSFEYNLRFITEFEILIVFSL